MRWAAMIAACLLAMPLFAQTNDIRPIARPNLNPSEQASAVPALRPIARPQSATVAEHGALSATQSFAGAGLTFGTMTMPQRQPSAGLATFSGYAVPRSLRPSARPASIEAAAVVRRTELLRGQVCGDPSIQGTLLGPVAGAGSCGIDDAVRVTSVAGVALSPKATMDCRTASALKTWVERGAIPVVGSEGGGLSSLRVVSHYACRGRNNQAGARLSEHAFGRAIDIAGIRLRDGTEMTVLTGWNSADDGAQLRQMWRAACGPFKTVLGPEANRFHLDHFHFDTARNRNRTYCR